MSGKIQAFFSGIYNPFASQEVARFVDHYRPDVAHVHNLYPLFSPSVLSALRRKGIPIVMTVHNHFHTCPTADHLFDGEICEKCVGGREYHCAIQNCRRNVFESLGYTVRSVVARKLRLFTANVTVTIALNEFARGRLLMSGFAPERVVVLPNSVTIQDQPADAHAGRYAMFSGRMCPEKGVATLLEAARRTAEIPVRLFGGGPTLDEHLNDAPENVEFRGQVDTTEIAQAYRGARFLVVPSRWFEGCPLVILEAMSFGLPVIASRIGGLSELVDEGVTGMLFEPGNGEELAGKMVTLWRDPGLCQKMGEAGRCKAAREFGEKDYWIRLKGIYELAMTVRA
jgi:glycosyltransferase involved in cell wall biosynthesis